jgi:hypothetical protein
MEFYDFPFSWEWKIIPTDYIIFFRGVGIPPIIELDDGKIYRKALYLMVKTMVSGSDFPLNQSNEPTRRCFSTFLVK